MNELFRKLEAMGPHKRMQRISAMSDTELLRLDPGSPWPNTLYCIYLEIHTRWRRSLQAKAIHAAEVAAEKAEVKS